MIKIKPLKPTAMNKKLWYFEFQNMEFKLALDTKKGYLVKRPESTQMYLVKHNHGMEISLDDDIV